MPNNPAGYPASGNKKPNPAQPYNLISLYYTLCTNSTFIHNLLEIKENDNFFTSCLPTISILLKYFLIALE